MRVQFHGTVKRLNLSSREDSDGVERKAVLTIEVNPDVVDLHSLALLMGLSSSIILEHPQTVLPGFFDVAGSGRD